MHLKNCLSRFLCCMRAPEEVAPKAATLPLKPIPIVAPLHPSSSDWERAFQGLPNNGPANPSNYSKITLNGNSYVATCDPMSKGALNFWKIIFELNCSMIIKLNRDEPGYLLLDQSRFEDLSIEVLDREELSEVLTRRTVLMRLGEITKKVVHFHFKGWPDFDIPNEADFKELQYFVQLEEQKIKEVSENAPIAVHCMAGIGRTGTYLTIHSNNKIESPDIPATIGALREQRSSHMVETAKQLEFIYNNINYTEEHLKF